MRIAYYPRHDGPEANIPTSVDASWEDLVGMLSDVTMTPCKTVRWGDGTLQQCKGKDCAHKHGHAWSPVDIEGTRANANVRAVTIAVFDLDHLDDAALLRVAERIEGFEYLVHSTHNPGSYRLVMPLSRDVPAAEWRPFLRAVIRELDIPSDPACKDLSRLFFLPTCPSDRTPLVERGSGVSLDVDEIMALVGPSTFIMPDIEDDLPPVVEEVAVDLNTLRGRLVEVRRRKAGSTKPEDAERYIILGRILKAEPLATEGARDNTINQAASLLAFVLPTATPKDAVVELLRPSLSAMATEPEGLSYWMERAERSYTRAMERRTEMEARRAVVDAEIKNRLVASARAREPSRAVHAETNEAGSDDDGAWVKDLLMRADGTSPKSCGQNVVTILARSPETRGTIRFNEVIKDIVVSGGPFDSIPSEVLAIAVTDWLQSKWGISLGVSEVAQRILRVAMMNSYDPLKNALNGLLWDGVKRVDDFLLYYCGACTLNAQGEDITPYLKSIGRKWLVSAVARALDPGCQVDTVLVLEGKQGLRKTSALRILGAEWFVETQLVLGDKDTQMMAASSWIVELAELASIRRTDTNGLKAFLTRRNDKYRPPYGRVMLTCARRCVFVGTTNDEEYLTDRTGNRRFWPVLCGPEMYDRLDDLRRDRLQLWAEAVTLYRAGETWWLCDEEQRVADGQAEERLGESAIEAKIAEWWYASHPQKRPDSVTSHDIAETVLKYPFDRISRSLQTEIGVALRRLGFNKARRMVAGRQAYVYAPTEMMKKAPQGGRPNHLRLVGRDDAKNGGQE